MLATTPRAATPAGAAAATAAGIALLFVGVLAAAPVSGLGPDATILTTATSDDDNEGVRRETTPASLARAPRQQREPTPDAHAGNNTRHRTEDGEARSEGRLRESRWGDRGE